MAGLGFRRNPLGGLRPMTLRQIIGIDPDRDDDGDDEDEEGED